MALSEREFIRLHKQLEAEHEEKLRALCLLAGKTFNPAPLVPAPTQKQKSKREPRVESLKLPFESMDEPISLYRKIQNVLGDVPADFKMKHVYDALVRAYPAERSRAHIKSTITSYLNRMVAKAQLDILKASVGKSAKVFRQKIAV